MVREKVRALAGHSALLCFHHRNEIPASIVRWLGRRRVEKFLKQMYRAAKAEDPDALSRMSIIRHRISVLPFSISLLQRYLESQERFEATSRVAQRPGMSARDERTRSGQPASRRRRASRLADCRSAPLTPLARRRFRYAWTMNVSRRRGSL